MKSNKLAVMMLMALIVSACTWVQLTPEGEKVRVLSAQEVEKCRLLGQTTANTRAKVAGVQRHDNAVDFELTALARNAAVNLGGDSVVAAGDLVDVKQTFKVYRCMPE
ncbi:MAG: DUF4156 domain-containing protein [Gammaproteobacteria bacterium]|nr:DUF4156 domain-containing protein [Gammaproteobacteria bacterium]